MKINYNEEAVKTLTKEEFLENQKHHAKDTDLSADYDKIVGAEKKVAATVPKKPEKE
jgi:hypothetical protein